MRLRWIAASLILGLTACSGGGGGSGSPAPAPITLSAADIQAISDAQAAIAAANAQNQIVESVSTATASGAQVNLFQFTDGTEVALPTRIIQSVSEDQSAWRATVRFTNQQESSFFLRGTTLGLDASQVSVNPFGTAPLSAQAQFSTPAPGRIRVVVQARGSNGIAMEHAFAATGRSFSLPVLGLYSDHANLVEFQFSDVAGNLLATDTVTVQTAALGQAFNLSILQNTLPADDDGVYMIANNKLAFDQRGEVRWALTDPAVSFVFRKLPNGSLTASNTDASASYHFGAFTETTMLGQVARRFDVPNLIHHEMTLSEATGTYFVATNSFPVANTAAFRDGLPEEDLVIEINPVTQQVVRQWDFNLLLDPDRVGINDPASRPDDWAHINAIYYDEADNSIVASVRSQSVVAKVDRDTGDLVWLLGAHGQWPFALQQYLLTPIDANGTPLDVNTAGFWPSGQHAPLKLPNGDILLYDNGNDRALHTGETVPALYSRAVQYRIDEVAMTIQLVDQFPDHQDWYTPATGDVDYLDSTGGRLISFLWGSADTPRIIELDAAGDVVFEATQNLGANYYRAEKFRLYDGIE